VNTAMNRPDVQQAVLRALASVAPEADTSTLDPRKPLREELDIDSMDFLNFVLALHASLGVDIPERDYGKLATLETCVDYLQERLAAARTAVAAAHVR
jgi:acyl carrier protein